MRLPMITALAVAGSLSMAAAAGPDPDSVTALSSFVGRMDVQMPEDGGDVAVDDSLVFEPLQMLDELFTRDDVVFLMRHGPTDWSMRDQKEVAPDDCANQRLMTPEGKDKIRQMGVLLATNDILPSQIAVSRWCRNQETVASLLAGFEQGRAGSGEIPIESTDDVNLLLALQGAPNVTALRNRISAWQGSRGKGPLLVISHFTNIQEVTEFSVYEGEILIVDPKRDNRVLGYLRLRSAGPDVGHFVTQ